MKNSAKAGGTTERDAPHRAVVGALRSAINDHGPITAERIGSAAKRVVGNLTNARAPSRPGDELLALFVNNQLWPQAFRLVAAHVRARLAPAEAAIVAPWFERLADGEDPRKVFPAKVGRPKGKTSARSTACDDYDLVFIVKRASDVRGAVRSKVIAEVAKVNGMKPKRLANICSELWDEVT